MEIRTHRHRLLRGFGATADTKPSGQTLLHVDSLKVMEERGVQTGPNTCCVSGRGWLCSLGFPCATAP